MVSMRCHVSRKEVFGMKVKMFGSHSLGALEESVNSFIEYNDLLLCDVKYQMSADGEWYTVVVLYRPEREF